MLKMVENLLSSWNVISFTLLHEIIWYVLFHLV